ncbi:hypothetical protein [Paracoccus shandongensis]|uniref:hypothetical protein n=1 Tax=Paracoccus shandongensis TaxID=2816048 RepID=UPI001A8DB07F|nr:hypothetical protein [Paracoccus shandongensis]
MTKKPQRRSNDYFLDRLRAEHPAVYADLEAGKLKNPAEAFRVAGLRKQTAPLDLLRSAWSKASAAEREAFTTEIGCISAVIRSAAPISTSAVVSPAKTMSSSTKQTVPPMLEAEVRRIMTFRNLTTGTVMREMGRGPHDASLGMALHRGTQIKHDLIVALEEWVKENRVT